MSNYDWKFSTIGGKNRVNIKSGEDIKHLGELDQKLWTVLSSPVVGLEFDAKTLKMLDSNNDGRIHVNEVVKAAEWITSVIKDPDLLLKKEDTLPLSAFNTDNPDGARLLASAKHILKNLGLNKDSISVADADDSVAIFAKTALNGDGIITEQSTKDDELKKAYGEMLDGCLAHPDQWDWYAMWMIEKTDGTHIGDLCFKGLEEDNPEIGYGILEEFQGNGYATEAVKLALQWAFDHPGIIAIEAETDPDNVASQKVLKKCGFEPNGKIGEEGPRFTVYNKLGFMI